MPGTTSGEGIPRGKQSGLYTHGCDYTRTTGIWQTVYMEFLPKSYIKMQRLHPTPKIKASAPS